MIATQQARNRSYLEALLQQELPEDQHVDALIELADHLERDGNEGQSAYEMLIKASQIAETIDYSKGLLDTRQALASWHFRRAEYPIAIGFARIAYEMSLGLEDSIQQYRALNTLAKIHGMIGNYAEALELFTRFFRLSEADGLRAYVPVVRANIGAIYIRMEEWDRALEESLAALEGTEVMAAAEGQRHILNVYDNLTFIHLNRNDPGAAKRSAEAGIAYCKSVDAPIHNTLLLMLGKAHQQLGDYDQAREIMYRARQTTAGMQGDLWEGLINLHLGILYREQEDITQAYSHLHAALALFEPLGTRSEIAQTHEQLYLLAKQKGDFETALLHYEAYHATRESLFNEQADARLKTIQSLHDLETARLEREAAVHREEALSQKLEEHERLIADLDAYAHSVAHDLKNPLSLIKASSEMLMHYGSEFDPTQIETLTNIMFNASTKAVQIVDTLLEIARIRRQELAPKPVDMYAVIDEVKGRLAATIQGRGAVIDVRHLPPALANAQWLEEVWVNLISNAIKYGGNPPVIHISGKLDGTKVHYTIRDNGDGITPAEQRRLFNSFSRLERHKDQIEGHGLGLHIVRTIVTKLGGRVWIESDGIYGKGTAFHFTLHAVSH